MDTEEKIMKMISSMVDLEDETISKKMEQIKMLLEELADHAFENGQDNILLSQQ